MLDESIDMRHRLKASELPTRCQCVLRLAEQFYGGHLENRTLEALADQALDFRHEDVIGRSHLRQHAPGVHGLVRRLYGA